MRHFSQVVPAALGMRTMKMTGPFEQNQSKRALDESIKGGFYFHPTDEDLSAGTPVRKNPLEDIAFVYIYSGFAIALALFMTTATAAGAQARFDAEAVRLNNRGVAQMSQQFTERAAASFAEAFQKDPKLAQAALNEGIALMAQQKLEEAKKELQQAIALEPNNAQAWYNLGLAQHAGNELEPALASFQQAVKIDPRDADSTYSDGVCYQEMKQ